MKRLLGLPALALIGLLVHSPKAHSHMSFGDDFECSDSYKSDCLVMGNSQRIRRLYFRGPDSELGPNCEWQTQKIELQIPRAETLLACRTRRHPIHKTTSPYKDWQPSDNHGLKKAGRGPC